MNGINILVEAKNEYTSQLKKILSPRIYEGFKSIYDDILNISNRELQENNVQSCSVIKAFQKTLKEIPLWNQEMIKKEYNRILTLSNCDFFDDLTEAVFISNVKILTSVQINDTKPMDLNINIPQSHHFIHKIYMECAKEFYKNPYVFDQSKTLNPKEKHNNLREALNMIDIGINNGISNLLPIKDILKYGLTKANNKVSMTNKSSNSNDENTKEKESEETEESDDVYDEDDEDEDDDEEDEEDDEDGSGSEDDNEEDDEGDEESESAEEDEETKTKESKTNTKIGGASQVEEVREVSDIKDNDKSENEIKKIDNNSEEKIIILGGGNNVSDITNDNDTNNDNHENHINLISKIPIATQVPVHHEDAKPIEEYKNIELNANQNVLQTKIENIEKVDSSNNIVEIHKPAPISGGNNPFMRAIKPSKFIKNKSFGHSNKNQLFYKKKYEENSAHYNSITENPTITNTLNNTINEIKDTQNSLKIIKNKIMLKEASSDEESEDDLHL